MISYHARITGGYGIGGIDYSSALIEIAKEVFASDASLKELICDEAINLPTNVAYDAIFSNSVFSYFPTENYAAKVLDKMLIKSNFSIGLLDIHDIEKKDAFEAYRRKTVENYDIKYKNLSKLFYHKKFFYEWADRNNCEIEFYVPDMEGYWNNEFVFDVYFFKK